VTHIASNAVAKGFAFRALNFIPVFKQGPTATIAALFDYYHHCAGLHHHQTG
jgi:hypothetical protein